MKKKLTLVVSLFLVMALSIGGTIAWLTDKTAAIENTFTIGNINIDLTETEGGDSKEFKMIPGNTIAKDPIVTVEGDSENCWLFVKIDESANLDDFITYTVDSAWTKLEEKDNYIVYYKEVDASDDDQPFHVLTDDEVAVKGEVTKKMLDDLTDETLPTLTFTAYAIQRDGNNFTTADAAWTEVSKK